MQVEEQLLKEIFEIVEGEIFRQVGAGLPLTATERVGEKKIFAVEADHPMTATEQIVGGTRNVHNLEVETGNIVRTDLNHHKIIKENV